MMRFLMIMLGLLLLTNCATGPVSQQADEEPVSVIPVPNPVDPPKPTVVIGPMVKQTGYGYAIEVMPAWKALASGTPGQEKVFVAAHPKLPVRFGSANVMSVVFVSRFNATQATMVDLFLARYSHTQVKTRQVIPGGYWLVTVDNRPGQRNALMFTRLLYNSQTKQAISYSLNMQVAADVEAMRNSSDIDAVAEALLNLFYIEPVG